MAYQSWSVVFGEQPSAAKWNILGSNDASFNDGSGIADGAIASAKLAETFFRGRLQANTTNSQVTGLTPQFGWGFISGSVAAVINETVTFPTAYTTLYSVLVTSAGTKTSDPSGITDSLAQASRIHTTTDGATTTGFSITMRNNDSSNFASGTRYAYSWLALGVV